MALVVKDRVQVTTSTTGTGTLTLGSAVTGFQDFSVIGNGNTTYYAITSNGSWEVGIGTYTSSGTTLSRDTVLASSNAGSKITLSGISNVFVTYPADKSIYYNASGNVGINTATPGTTLDVNGTFRGYGIATFDGATYYAQNFAIAGTHKGYLASANAIYGGGSANDLVLDSSSGQTVLATGDLARFTIDTSGNATLNTANTSILNSSGRKILNQTGSILQVVNATTATQVSANSGTWVDTGLTATITPSSTSSKILVIVQQAGCGKDTNDTTLQLQLLRGSTALLRFESVGAWTGSAARNFIGTCGTSYVDSPATTSAVTYKTQQSMYSPAASGYTQYNVGAGNATSTITLLEIAG